MNQKLKYRIILHRISNFPQKKIGNVKNACNHSCKAEWLQQWQWLNYKCVEKDSLLCYPSNQAYFQKKLLINNYEKTFINGEGFSNWKKATGKDGKFVKHENSDYHQEAVKKFCDKRKDIGTVQ